MRTELGNAEIADLLSQFAALLELAERSPFAVRAYARASELVRSNPLSVAGLVRDGRVRELRGIGPGIESKLRELIETGGIHELAALQNEYPLELVSYGRLHGVSARRMSSIALGLGVKTVPELEAAVAAGRRHRREDRGVDRSGTGRRSDVGARTHGRQEPYFRNGDRVGARR
jgi:DNA polymerase (family 10)